MHLSRMLVVATCLAAVAAFSAECFAAQSMTAPTRARARSACQAGGQPEAKSLAFVVYRAEYRPAGEIVLTFENGEVWQQTDRNKKLDIERGEQVVIRRSKSGVFTLVTRSGESVRVKRMH